MNFKIQSGPFRGMKYISKSNGSVLFPKLYGIYEKELHGYIEKVILKNYKNIVDIGCAEGYYAVGLAYRTQNNDTDVYAFDVNNEAIQNLNMLADMNGLPRKIKTGGLCDYNVLNGFEKYNTFILCDIEGAEMELLDPLHAPNLLTYDMLVEVHDGGQQSNRIKEVLSKRFSHTHNIEMINYTGRNEKDVSFVKNIGGTDATPELIDEGRIYGLEWMYLTRKGNGK